MVLNVISEEGKINSKSKIKNSNSKSKPSSFSLPLLCFALHYIAIALPLPWHKIYNKFSSNVDNKSYNNNNNNNNVMLVVVVYNLSKSLQGYFAIFLYETLTSFLRFQFNSV